MNRSRSGQRGLAGLWRICRFHNATLISAMPIGMPGCPELAAWTASIAKARIALASRAVSGPRFRVATDAESGTESGAIMVLIGYPEGTANRRRRATRNGAVKR